MVIFHSFIVKTFAVYLWPLRRQETLLNLKLLRFCSTTYPILKDSQGGLIDLLKKCCLSSLWFLKVFFGWVVEHEIGISSSTDTWCFFWHLSHLWERTNGGGFDRFVHIIANLALLVPPREDWSTLEWSLVSFSFIQTLRSNCLSN